MLASQRFIRRASPRCTDAIVLELEAGSQSSFEKCDTRQFSGACGHFVGYPLVWACLRIPSHGSESTHLRRNVSPDKGSLRMSSWACGICLPTAAEPNLNYPFKDVPAQFLQCKAIVSASVINNYLSLG